MKNIKTSFIHNRKLFPKIKKHTKKKKINKICSILIFTLLYVINSQLFEVKTKKPFKGRIFLCTSYNNEAEVAYIHIWRIYDYIYKFIFVTSNRTHSGLPKNFTFKPYEENIKPYMDKIDIIYYNDGCNKNEYPNIGEIWCTEMCQRDYAKIYIKKNYNVTEEDLLIVVDIDEILTREGIKYIIQNPPKDYYFIYGALYFPYYYHRLEDWNRGLVVRYRKNMRTLSKYRKKGIKKGNTLKFLYKPSKPLITHCSYCFKNIDEYRNKLLSYIHQEYNKPPYITNDWIFKSHYCRIKIASKPNGYDEPYEGWKHLIPDDERLKYLIDRSFIYPLKLTNYSKKDLETMCNKAYNRTPFEPSTKFK